VVKTVRKAAPKELTDVKLFDIFTSKELGKGRSSRAYSLCFRSDDRTLTDDEVNAASAKIIEALKSSLAVEIRDN
jgi:phenylalanyl-tRNA synthetase beta chain